MQKTKKIIAGEIITNSKIAPDHLVMQIKSTWLAKHAKAGQFVTIKVEENTTDPLLRIPLAVYDVDGDTISLLYKVVGKATQILSTKKSSEHISLLGPLGNGFELKKNIDAILVAGGCGIAPLYLLAKNLIANNNKVTIFIGAFNKSQILAAEKFSNLGAKVCIATEDGSLGFKGYVTELLDSRLRVNDDTMIYASGPHPMLKALAKITKQFNITAQLSLEEYMACGIGVCRGCAVPTAEGYKLCCKDGPVFYADTVYQL